MLMSAFAPVLAIAKSARPVAATANSLGLNITFMIVDPFCKPV